MDKFSELKAAALAATPGPWASVDDEWSDGDHANITNEERSDGSIIAIAQVEGGGSESGYDEPFSNEQQANAAFIAAANPAAILTLLAELEAKDKRIAELEQDELATQASSRAVHEAQENHINQQQDRIDSLEKKNGDLGRALGAAEKRLATPVRLMGEMLLHDWEHSVERQAAFQHRKTAWDARLEEDKKAIRAAGFTFTVEGDE